MMAALHPESVTQASQHVATVELAGHHTRHSWIFNPIQNIKAISPSLLLIEYFPVSNWKRINSWHQGHDGAG